MLISYHNPTGGSPVLCAAQQFRTYQNSLRAMCYDKLSDNNVAIAVNRKHLACAVERRKKSI